MSSMHFDDWPTTTDFDALMEPCLNTPVEMTCLPRGNYIISFFLNLRYFILFIFKYGYLLL